MIFSERRRTTTDREMLAYAKALMKKQDLAVQLASKLLENEAVKIDRKEREVGS